MMDELLDGLNSFFKVRLTNCVSLTNQVLKSLKRNSVCEVTDNNVTNNIYKLGMVLADIHPKHHLYVHIVNHSPIVS